MAEAGIESSVGSFGDSVDNALADIIIGRFKTEVLRHDGPWRGVADVEYATLAWISGFNTVRLLEPLRYLPPAEYEQQSHQAQLAQIGAMGLNEPSLRESRCGSPDTGQDASPTSKPYRAAYLRDDHSGHSRPVR